MSCNLVTGGLGFIGLHLAKALAERGERSILFDVATPPRLEGRLGELCSVARGDLGNWAQVMDVVKSGGVTCVYHTGAMLPPASEQSTAAAFAANVTGTFNVLEATRLFGVGPVIYTSSIAAFGPTDADCVSDSAAQHPANMYGTTKVCGERLCEYYRRRYDLDIRAVRFESVIGAGRPPGGGITAYTSRVIEETALGSPYVVNVHPAARTAILYVNDAVDAIVRIRDADRARLTQCVYNVYGFTASARELVDAVLRHVPGAQVRFEPDEKVTASMKTLPAVLDDRPARADWGWSMRFGLDDAVRDFVAQVAARRT